MSRNKKENLLSPWALIAASILFMGFQPRKGVEPEVKITLPKVLAFKNWGLGNSIGPSHISLQDAWKLETGKKEIIVAVIDTGIDPNHPDLKNNLWQDPAYKNQKVYGWDFVKNQPNPIDEHGHGTHVSGIVGALFNPASGTSGIAQKVSIMAVKYYSEKNTGAQNLRNTVAALNYAIDHGANIINYSGGGPEFSEDEYLALRRAELKGILVVAAAGNERQNTDLAENYYYPAAYRLSNIISVAATDIQNHLLPSSNWGKKRVDVAAPGSNILSTLPGGTYGSMSGTSQATAFVTGLAVLMLSKNSHLRPSDIRSLVVGSVDRLPELQEKVLAGGRINAYRTLVAMNSAVKPSAPAAPALAEQQNSTLDRFLSTSALAIPARSR